MSRSLLEAFDFRRTLFGFLEFYLLIMRYRRSQFFAALILAALAASLAIGANPSQPFARLLHSFWRGSENSREISNRPVKRATLPGLNTSSEADDSRPKQRAHFTIYRNE